MFKVDGLHAHRESIPNARLTARDVGSRLQSVRRSCVRRAMTLPLRGTDTCEWYGLGGKGID